MGRRRQTKAECYAKYDEMEHLYEEEGTRTEAAIASLRSEGAWERFGAQIWHLEGLLKRYDNALARMPERRSKACDWRPEHLTTQQEVDLMSDICSSVQHAWEEFDDQEQDRIVAYYYRHGPDNIAAHLQDIADGIIY